MRKDPITQDMIKRFNALLEQERSILRLTKAEDDYAVHIRLMPDPYLDNTYSSICPSEAFYEKLEGFFREEGIPELTYNNTKGVFWTYASFESSLRQKVRSKPEGRALNHD